MIIFHIDIIPMAIELVKSNKQFGFTLVELVLIIFIISILAIAVTSSFSGKAGYVESSYQTRLISLARHVQYRAMQDTGDNNRCYQVNINTPTVSFTFPNFTTNTARDCDTAIFDPTDANQVALPSAVDGSEMADEGLSINFTNGTSPYTILRFDAMGRATSYNTNGTGVKCNGNQSCRIVISHPNYPNDAKAVCVAGEGYIYGC